jgi:hypothetical protein
MITRDDIDIGPRVSIWPWKLTSRGTVTRYWKGYIGTVFEHRGGGYCYCIRQAGKDGKPEFSEDVYETVNDAMIAVMVEMLSLTSTEPCYLTRRSNTHDRDERLRAAERPGRGRLR